MDEQTETSDQAMKMDEQQTTQTIKLISNDNTSFDIAKDAAQLSEFVKDIVDEDDDEDNEVSNVVINVERVNGKCLENVVKFLQHYHEEPMKELTTPLEGNSFEAVMDQKWYQDFMSDESISQEMLFDLMAAANYMGITPLLRLACLRITFRLTSMTAEQIQEYLNLPTMTKEEEAKAREEHKWIFEDS